MDIDSIGGPGGRVNEVTLWRAHGRRRSATLLLSALLAVGASGCGVSSGTDEELDVMSSALQQSGKRPELVPAVTLSQRQGQSLFVTRLSEQGSLTTEFATAAPTVSLHGGSVRYADQQVIALDYANRAAIQTTLSAAATEHGLRLAAVGCGWLRVRGH